MPVARKLSSILLATVLVVVLPVPPAIAELPPDSAQPSHYLGAVTLITGDHVSVRRVGARLVPNVLPAPGREHVQFATVGTGGELSIVPSDAWAPLNAGRLDRRLFDVAALLRDGYGDAGRADLPLIVQPGGAAALTDAGATVTQTLSSVDAAVVRQPKESVADFWTAHRDAGRIWLDGMRKPSLDASVPQIGAPTAWRAGYTGRDVTIAVLDTGIDDTHPDLRNRIAGMKSFIPGTDVRDTAGHGTHVASTIAGTGRASSGRYTGVAPDARLLIGKVCEGGCPESAILAGMEWAAAAGAKVVNLSLGGPDTADDDPLELAVNRLTARYGTLFVIAAGNDGGYGAETVSSPASADAALAVGAVDKQDAIAGFSGRGPRVRDAALKPEIVAPGVEITAARSRFSGLGKKGDRYVALGGTSMATPHVAGAAAILAQQHPDWTGPRLKAALMSSAKTLADTGTYAQGAGRVDVATAITQSLQAEPPSVSFGRMAWPHEDDRPVTRTVTYRNPGPAPVTLRLSVTATGPDGESVPDGMFRLSVTEITVPAGGHAGVDITANTAIPAAEGTFGAHILATGGAGHRVTTPVAVDREPESYDLTLRPLDGAGRATDLHFSFLFGIDRARYRPIPGIGGSGTLRVRRGTYHVDATIATPRADGTGVDSSKVAHPTVTVGADTSLVVDASAARPIAVTFDRPNVRDRVVAAGYSRFTEHSTLITGVLGDTFDRILIGQVGDPLPRTEMVADIGGMWAVPDAQGDVTRSTVTYNLQWFDYGRLPDGLARHIVDADLAEVRTRYREQADRKRATKVWVVREPELGIGVGFGFGFRLPLDRTEFHNLDGLRWSAEFQQWDFVKKQVHFETVLTGGVVDHEPGQSYVEEWNTAVFGPGFTRDDEWASRSGDQFLLNIPMYSDAGPDRAGQSELDSGSTVLYLGDTRLGETNRPGSGQFDVPAEPNRYRLETTAQRGRGTDVSDLSTRISCVWTFTSVRPPDPDPGPKTADKGKEGTALPLMVVRFAPPDLNPHNESRAATALVPVTVQRQAGAPEATVTELAVEASFDDGRTWRTVEVTRGPDPTAVARIDHPRGARHVSLRAMAADSAGNTVEQTVIRAYGLR
ncbi:MAG TPA: S8 family serine peptidase [Actinophytocola sp.]|uniref:S8 family peptidase n=1 Tax=Actinophytocola sp. TaxID=1872138 RepID=UPI002DDCF065|nr:S8 family serine peptidase [Actinophytocola sp.]HEV2780456.1 S8 family serine peptidase [Actinophytocola sp.]